MRRRWRPPPARGRSPARASASHPGASPWPLASTASRAVPRARRAPRRGRWAAVSRPRGASPARPMARRKAQGRGVASLRPPAVTGAGAGPRPRAQSQHYLTPLFSNILQKSGGRRGETAKGAFSEYLKGFFGGGGGRLSLYLLYLSCFTAQAASTRGRPPRAAANRLRESGIFKGFLSQKTPQIPEQMRREMAFFAYCIAFWRDSPRFEREKTRVYVPSTARASWLPLTAATVAPASWDNGVRSHACNQGGRGASRPAQ